MATGVGSQPYWYKLAVGHTPVTRAGGACTRCFPKEQWKIETETRHHSSVLYWSHANFKDAHGEQSLHAQMSIKEIYLKLREQRRDILLGCLLEIPYQVYGCTLLTYNDLAILSWHCSLSLAQSKISDHLKEESTTDRTRVPKTMSTLSSPGYLSTTHGATLS